MDKSALTVLYPAYCLPMSYYLIDDLTLYQCWMECKPHIYMYIIIYTQSYRVAEGLYCDLDL